MKNVEKTKKGWLWWLLGAVALLAAAAVTLVLFLQPAQPQQGQGQTDVPVSSKLYWNIDGKAFTENSETGLSTREPDANGIFTIRFLCEGQILELQTADRQLVNFIDTMELMGLIFDENGYIMDAKKPKEVAVELGKEMFVKVRNGDILEVNSSMAMNGMSMEFDITGVAVMDVRPDAPEFGAATPLETMDKVTIYGDKNGKVTSVFFLERQETAGVYIRVDQKWDSVNASTARVPDENGVYTILMAHEGKQVEMKTKDKSVATDIDYGSDANQFKGLYLDEEGYVTKAVSVNVAIRGLQNCNVYHVTKIEGNTVTVERLLFHGGKTETFTIDADTKIYNTDYLSDCLFDYVGQPVESLQINDRVTVYTDMFGLAKYVFLSKRMVEGIKLYYNKTVMYDGTKQETTRPKDANGYYVFEMGCEGKTVKLKTKDKELAGKIERKYLQTMGLKVENGIIKEIYDFSCVTGFLAVGNNLGVTELTGNILRLVPGGNPDGGANYVLSENAEIYNITGDYGTKYYQKDTLQQYDVVTAHRDIYGDISHVMIQQRYQAGTKVYYNISRKYDSVNQVTTRVPDAEGYYVFDMLCDGNRVKVKTKNKEIATIIDRQYSPFAALKVSNGIVKAAYAAASAFPAGTKVANYNYIGKMEGDTFNTYYYTNEGEIKWQAATFKLAKNCKVYNVSENYSKTYGEKTKIQMHDQIQGFAANAEQEVVAIYVLSRKLNGDIYWPVDRQFDSAKLVSTRTPDAEGWYYVDLLVKGQIKTFKTKEAVVINRVDSYSTGFAMEVKGDVIQKAGSANSALNYGGTAVSNLDVSKVTDKKLTVERMRPGEADSGKKTELELAKNYKVYDVSSYAEPFGAPAELSFGDRIIAYRNKDGKVCEIYIVNKNTHKDGAVSHCPHCDQDVFWEPYLGVIHEGNMHYYMAGDFLTWQRQIGKDDAGATTYDVVLDLNGKTLTSYGRNFLVYDKLTIMDLAGGGRMEGFGVDGWATSILLLNGGELNITGGTITTMADSKTATMGGLIYAQSDCIINITGGVLEKGKASGQGGAIYLSGSTLNMSGGEIRDCAATAGTGLYIVGSSKLNISGGTIDGTIEGGANGKTTLSGAPKLTGLYVPAGVKVQLGELTEGAEIAVAASGVFTETTDQAETYKAYFKPAVEQTAIKVVDNALSIVDALIISRYCPHCDQEVSWEPYRGVIQESDMHYYMAGDLLTWQRSVGKDDAGATTYDVVLDLNGKTLNSYGRNFLVYDKLTIMDLAGGGRLEGSGVDGWATSILLLNGGELNIMSGTIATAADSKTATAGGLIYAQGDCTINITGGVLEKGKTSGQGGAIYLSGSALNVSGGEIRDCTATAGTGLYIVGSSKLNISGGIIDGTIEGGTNSKTILSGAPKLTGLHVPAGVKVQLGELTEGAEITVTANGVFTEATENAETYKAYFKSAVEDTTIKVTDNALSVGNALIISHYCPHCNQEVSWEPYLGVIQESDMHYYMASDFLTWQRSVGTDDNGATTYDVVLDLNGKTLNSYGRNFLVYDKLTIMDLAGGGKLEGSGVDGWATSILVLNGGELNIMSGTITTAEDSKTATAGGLIYAQGDCTINITGGVLEKGKTSGQGGAIYLSGSALNMSGGEIRDCTAAAGSGVYAVGSSRLNLSGGTIDGTIEGSVNSKLYLSGTPKLTGLFVPDGVKVQLGELTEGAQITVAANGVFTEETENAETYKNYFKPAMGQTEIKVEGNALSTAKDMTISNDPLEFVEGTQDAWCSVCRELVTWTPITGGETFVQMLDNHYYLANDIAVNAAGNGKEGYLYVSGGSNLGSICLHLNDHDLIVSGHRAIMGGPRPLNVLGNGNVSGYSVGIGTSGSAVHLNAGKGAGVISLYGGTYTKDATDTESAILYVGYNGGTLNMYEGVLVDATGKTSTACAAGVFVQGGGSENQGPAYFNMYGGTIQNGTSTVGGGNLRLSNQYGTAKIYGGTIIGGSAPEGGNIYCAGGTLQFLGSKDSIPTVSGGAATNGEGGNIRIKDAKQLQLKYAHFLGGTSTNHGGNISIMRVPTTIEEGTLINGGTSKTYGGAVRVYQTRVIMTGGEIKGGNANSEWSHNVWLAGTAASPAIFDMRGGTVYATPGFSKPNTAIYAHSNAHVYLSGDATVDDGENPASGMRISNTSKLYICDGWSGRANVRFQDIYSSGTVVPTDYAQVVTVDENLNATVGGSFTGILHQLAGSVLNVEAQEDGSLIIKVIQ